MRKLPKTNWQDKYINKIICGDCLEVMKKLPDGCVDAVVTDPPYGINFEYKSYDDSFENWINLVPPMIVEAIRISKGAVVMTAGQYRTELWLYKNLPPKWRMCWYKGACNTLCAMGFKHWDVIFCYGNIYRKQPDYFYAKPEQKRNSNHPCPKSVEWARKLTKIFTDENDIILDPFLGSGTTAVAAIRTGRRFIGIEIDPKYCEIARKRVEKALIKREMEIFNPNIYRE